MHNLIKLRILITYKNDIVSGISTRTKTTLSPNTEPLFVTIHNKGVRHPSLTTTDKVTRFGIRINRFYYQHFHFDEHEAPAHCLYTRHAALQTHWSTLVALMNYTYLMHNSRVVSVVYLDLTTKECTLLYTITVFAITLYHCFILPWIMHRYIIIQNFNINHCILLLYIKHHYIVHHYIVDHYIIHHYIIHGKLPRSQSPSLYSSHPSVPFTPNLFTHSSLHFSHSAPTYR